MLILIFFPVLALFALGIWFIIRPKKVFQLFHKHNFSRMLYKNFDKLEPNNQMYLSFQVSGVLLIILGIMFLVPFYDQIVPQERHAVEIIQDTSKFTLEYPLDNTSHFKLLKYDPTTKQLTDIEVNNIERLFEDVKVGLSLQSQLTQSPYSHVNYPHDPYAYLELSLDNNGEKFIFYNKDKAYYLNEDYDHFPLKDYEALYDYLLSLREDNRS